MMKILNIILGKFQVLRYIFAYEKDEKMIVLWFPIVLTSAIGSL